jgi:ACS family tartrate transporter-like MFS transporter
MLFLSLWFPFAYRARYNAMFNYAVPASMEGAAFWAANNIVLGGVLTGGSSGVNDRSVS